MESLEYNLKGNLNAPASEAYKVLRTNVQFCGFENKVKTLTITSCNPGEGKTTTAINLAISMAKTGIKVLLVDADLRKPMVVKRLGYKAFNGLSNIISGTARLDDVVNDTEIKGFHIVSSGPKPPNPAELVGSSRFKDFLQEASEKFDMVIIDTPPLGSVIDCAIMAAQTDGTLIVVEAGSVEYKDAKRVKEQLEKVNARVLGVVLNKIVKSEYKKYYSYYNYGLKDQKINLKSFKKYKGNEKEKVTV